MGQAGIPNGPACLLTPALVQQLPDLPILFLVAGGDHSLVVMRHGPDGQAQPIGMLQNSSHVKSFSLVARVACMSAGQPPAALS